MEDKLLVFLYDIKEKSIKAQSTPIEDQPEMNFIDHAKSIGELVDDIIDYYDRVCAGDV